jgi:hypothetical protein
MCDAGNGNRATVPSVIPINFGLSSRWCTTTTAMATSPKWESRSVLTSAGKDLGVAVDFNDDGHMDVFVANDSVPEFLYQNKRNGTFEDIGLLSGVGVDGDGHVFAGMGVDFADYDNDGLPVETMAMARLHTQPTAPDWEL